MIMHKSILLPSNLALYDSKFCRSESQIVVFAVRCFPSVYGVQRFPYGC